jgi:hypothetical protein
MRGSRPRCTSGHPWCLSAIIFISGDFPGGVLPKQDMHLPLPKIGIDVVECLHSREAFRDIADSKRKCFLLSHWLLSLAASQNV